MLDSRPNNPKKYGTSKKITSIVSHIAAYRIPQSCLTPTSMEVTILNIPMLMLMQP
jgi:hypothetical protein